MSTAGIQWWQQVNQNIGDLNLSEEQMLEATDLPLARVRSNVAGETSWTLLDIERLSKAAGVPAEDLLRRR